MCRLSRVAAVEEWVDHDDSTIVLAVGEILRIEDVAAHCLRCGENGTVPVRQLIALAECDAGSEDVERHILHRKVTDAVDELRSLGRG